ncbi:MAG: amidohydrolase [Alphaproteobacteria bacterium]|nr:MAG: amidohydrolase [Alphaproteobacteria bacterium]
MSVLPAMKETQDDIAVWRREMHKHPETAFEEFWTSDYIAARLDEWGVPYTRGWAKTGIVATLHGKNGPAKDKNTTVILRADMDALHMTEETGLPYASTHQGKMHGCGHDGHSAMLLGAVQYLSRHTDSFDGTVHFVFQPAEEGEGGARVMVEEGFFDKYPCKAIYGLHNWPAMKKGTMGICAGAMTAASDRFKIKITGKGGHAAMPHQNIDVVTAASSLVMALQTLISRATDPMQGAVISVTLFRTEGSDSLNVMPEAVSLGGTVRTFGAENRDMIETRIREMADSTAAAFRCTAKFDYTRGYPSVVNSAAETELAAAAAMKTVGEENVDVKFVPTMGGEDFAFFLEKCPGAYIALGQADEDKKAQLHSPHYDFNDAVAPIGASYWVHLVETTLPVS